MLQRQAITSRNMSEQLQIVFQAVIRVVNYVQPVQWEEDSLQSYVVMSQNTGHSMWMMLALSCQSALQGIWN